MSEILWFFSRNVAHATFGESNDYFCGERRKVEDKQTQLPCVRRCDRCVEAELEPRFLRVRREVDARNQTWQLRLEWEDGELTEIADELMTSSSPIARSSRGEVLCLKGDDVRWLHEQLGQLIAQWDAADRGVSQQEMLRLGVGIHMTTELTESDCSE